MSAQHLEHLPLAALTPYAANSRTHSGDQVRQIARSIEEFGFTNPVLIDGAGGIIAGHGRVQAGAGFGHPVPGRHREDEGWRLFRPMPSPSPATSGYLVRIG